MRLRLHGTRLALQSNETAAATVVYGRQRLTVRLRPAVTKVLRLRGHARRLTVRVVDASGNTTTLRRTVRP